MGNGHRSKAKKNVTQNKKRRKNAVRSAVGTDAPDLPTGSRNAAGWDAGRPVHAAPEATALFSDRMQTLVADFKELEVDELLPDCIPAGTPIADIHEGIAEVMLPFVPSAQSSL